MKKKYYIITFILFFSCSLFGQTNIDFELTPAGTYTTANAVSGWTISSQTATSCNSSTVWTLGSPEFSIVGTPILSFSTIGIIPNSPLGGTVVAQLNNFTANSSVTKLANTFSVTNTSTLCQFAYAGIWQNGSHLCCEEAGLKVRIKDQFGNEITCPSFSLAGFGCQYVPTYTVTSGTTWTSWKVNNIDLTPYLGTIVTLEVTVNDCRYGDHYGTILFDAKYTALPIGNCYCNVNFNLPNLVNFCPGSSLATITGPVGFPEYTWAAPAGYPITYAQSTLGTLSLTNAVVGNIYTLTVVNQSSTCILSGTYALIHSTVAIAGIGSSSTCAGGSSGSATVVASGGSGSGYNYTWINSTNSLVAVGGTITNLPSGTYSVTATDNGTHSLTCGTATATTTVGVLAPGVINLLKPFCGIEAYLSYPGGSNYQWYNNLSPITASLGGTASSYTVSAPVNNAIYRLSYTSPQGCHDSLKITLIQTPSGNIGLLSNATICQGATNGTAVISMTPAAGAPLSLNSFSVFSVGSTPTYSSSTSSFSLNTFTATGLSAGSIYSVSAFDGLCKYSTSFTVPAFTFNYSLTSTSPTICSGNNVAANISFSSTSTLGQYTYSWSPSIFLLGATSQNALISPTTNPGNQVTLTYSVIVTPTLVNCPLTKTLSIVVSNPNTPTISSIPILCNNSMSAYSISVNPPGGTYSGGGIGFTSVGTILPAFSSIGTFTFIYTAPPQGNCTSTSTGNYTVDASPVINPLGNQLSICSGQVGSLNVTSTGSYTWSTGIANGPITVTPATTTSYTVFALDATNNCSAETVLTLTVVPMPTISISGNSICSGNSGTLTASGATSYSWSNGSTSSVITVPPINGTSYTILGANSQTCVNTSSTVLNIIPIPTITISGNSSVCDGQPVTLVGSGASTYNWNNIILGAILSLTPTSTSVFTLTGTDIITNCSAKKTITINVLPNPTLSIAGDTTFCLGETKSLSVIGANIYSWSNGANSSTISITPTFNSNYTVLGTNTLGSCSSSKTISILVSPCASFEKDTPSYDLSIYPNPTSGKFFIEAENIRSIVVTDELGKIILEEHFQKENYQLDLSGYSNGIYFLKLFQNSEIKTLKLIKSD